MKDLKKGFGSFRECETFWVEISAAPFEPDEGMLIICVHGSVGSSSLTPWIRKGKAWTNPRGLTADFHTLQLLYTHYQIIEDLKSVLDT